MCTHMCAPRVCPETHYLIVQCEVLFELNIGMGENLKVKPLYILLWRVQVIVSSLKRKTESLAGEEIWAMLI